MPITTSAKKALRASKRKRVFNDARKLALKRAVAAVKKAADASTGLAVLPAAFQAIDKATKRGVIKKNTAARKKANLAARFKKQ